MTILKGHLKSSVLTLDLVCFLWPLRAHGSCLCSSSFNNVFTTHCCSIVLGNKLHFPSQGDSCFESLEDCQEAACHDFLRILKALSYQCFPFPFFASAKNCFDIMVTSQLGFLAVVQENPACWSLLACFPQLSLIFELVIYYYGYIRFFLAPARNFQPMTSLRMQETKILEISVSSPWALFTITHPKCEYCYIPTP